ncbi:hypothetical protein NQ314_019445 [Rhamnusium bicolor]|uniref:PiggyBac transposable element-derived protein domain-containing protein n=1 Tax=Rhamnusium bicolor TaxID=1586634 RepID=A0AAV8WNH0_9CUCU|nr:hypothetical protein NQ314_019445 [Rhamnusium bicolor]
MGKNCSDLELSDDEAEYENEFQAPTRDIVRIGADKVGPKTFEIAESHWDNEDDLPLSLFAGTGTKSKFNDIITKKDDIKWCKRDFKNPDIVWNKLLNQSNDEAEVLSPLDYFQKYINDAEFEKMANFTNIYAHQENVHFKPTDAAEIRSLFGLHIAAGCLKFPKVRLFWDKTLCINLFRDTMSRDRFFQLRTNLHCVNNLEIPQNCNDKLYKVRPLYDAIRDRCLQLDLEENLCIDEQIVPFRGQLSIKQYIKNKPTPLGCKNICFVRKIWNNIRFFDISRSFYWFGCRQPKNIWPWSISCPAPVRTNTWRTQIVL